MANSTLMPPILEFNYPSFDMTKESHIFIGKLSINNNMKQVDHVQIKITQVDDDKNGFNKEVIPRDIYFMKNDSEDIFYIKLFLTVKSATIFANSVNFLVPTRYKMQVRLGYKDASRLEEMYNEEWGQDVPQDWLDRNGELFSEWSNTSLIKTTVEPEISIIGLKIDELNILNNPYQLFNGTFKNLDKTEQIQSYNIALLDLSEHIIDEKTKTYVEDYITPSLTYQIKKFVKTGIEYKIRLIVYTTDDLEKEITYRVFFNEQENEFPLLVEKIIDNVNAKNILKIRYNSIFPTIEKILIKRLSIANEYNSYDDIFLINDISLKNKDIYFSDYFINSDELYIYYLQIVYKNGEYSALSSPIPIKNKYDFSYILGEDGEQFKILDSVINTMTIVTKDTLSETLGSKYPIMQRIGNIKYKTFTFGGVITYLNTDIDEENQLREKTIDKIYGAEAPLEIKEILENEYGDNNKHNYSSSINYFVEKEYRDTLSNFLSNGKIKIIKSPSERLMICTFMNFSLVPKKELSRSIYDFTVNANEIMGEKDIDYFNFSIGEVYEL